VKDCEVNPKVLGRIKIDLPALSLPRREFHLQKETSQIKMADSLLWLPKKELDDPMLLAYKVDDAQD
jgi:hypothetical protein